MSARRTKAIIDREIKAKRQYALDRFDLRYPTEPRKACGKFGMEKIVDPNTRRLIDDAVRRRKK